MKSKKKGTLICNIVAVLLFVFVITATVKAVCCKAQGKINFVFGKYAIMYVVSGSMEPKIPTKSYIIIEKADASKIETDDIITFYSDDPAILGKINTHRVVEIQGDEFVTKGDNVLTIDPATAKADKIVGKYVANAKLLTGLGNAFMSKTGAIFIFGFLILSVVLAIVRVVITAYTNKNKEEEKQDDGKDEEQH